MKRIASIQDISCLGRCSLTVALPVISAMAVECAIVPTAVLSTHTMFPGFISRDLSDQLLPIARHWKSQNVTLDAICTGYLASPLQTEEVCRFFDLLAGPDTLLFVDPAMADGGRLYSGGQGGLAQRHGEAGCVASRDHHPALPEAILDSLSAKPAEAVTVGDGMLLGRLGFAGVLFDALEDGLSLVCGMVIEAIRVDPSQLVPNGEGVDADVTSPAGHG